VTVGNDPAYLAVDQATDTIYVPNAFDNTVSVIDGNTSNDRLQPGSGNNHVGMRADPDRPGWRRARRRRGERSHRQAYVANNADADVSVLRG
jgi:hypothetical protein